MPIAHESSRPKASSPESFPFDFSITELIDLAGQNHESWGPGTVLNNTRGYWKVSSRAPSLHIAGEYVTMRKCLSTVSSAKMIISYCKHRPCEKLGRIPQWMDC